MQRIRDRLRGTSPRSYRPGVGIMLLNRQGLVWVGNRHDLEHDAWQMPQGGIDKGEEPEAAAVRELWEEVGTKAATVLAENADWLSYDFLEGSQALGGIFSRYRGQRQKWFAMRFDGDDSEFQLDHHEREFSEWKWVEMRDLPELIAPFKRHIYEQIIKEFEHLIES